MRFRTEIKIAGLESIEITHRHKIAMVGSCFTNNIGNKLKEDKFDLNINPFGILFNPISAAKAIDDCIYQNFVTEDDLIQHNEQWVSLHHHSSLGAPSKQEALSKINNNIKASEEYYTKGDFLILTFGTAWVYKLKETNDYVANCHKMPATLFEKKLLSIDEIVETYTFKLKEWRIKNPRLKILLTISPVRHWKDGATENNQSKAVLQLAIMQLVNKLDSVFYFPSYEIVLDELRDYRFYTSDMLHPNELAVNYIYEKFEETLFSPSTKTLNMEIRKIKRAVKHKPFNFNSESHQKFIRNTKNKIAVLEKKYPFLSFEDEYKLLHFI